MNENRTVDEIDSDAATRRGWENVSRTIRSRRKSRIGIGVLAIVVAVGVAAVPFAASLRAAPESTVAVPVPTAPSAADVAALNHETAAVAKAIRRATGGTIRGASISNLSGGGSHGEFVKLVESSDPARIDLYWSGTLSVTISEMLKRHPGVAVTVHYVPAR